MKFEDIPLWAKKKAMRIEVRMRKRPGNRTAELARALCLERQIGIAAPPIDDGREDNLIGYLSPNVQPDGESLGFVVACYACRLHDETVKVFRSNIGDYKQLCHFCGEVLVEGKTPAWPELFSVRRSQQEG